MKVNLGGLLSRAKPMWIEIAQSASASAEAEKCAHHLKVRQGTEWLLTNHNGTDKTHWYCEATAAYANPIVIKRPT